MSNKKVVKGATSEMDLLGVAVHEVTDSMKAGTSATAIELNDYLDLANNTEKKKGEVTKNIREEIISLFPSDWLLAYCDGGADTREDLSKQQTGIYFSEYINGLWDYRVQAKQLVAKSESRKEERKAFKGQIKYITDNLAGYLKLEAYKAEFDRIEEEIQRDIRKLQSKNDADIEACTDADEMADLEAERISLNEQMKESSIKYPCQATELPPVEKTDLDYIETIQNAIKTIDNAIGNLESLSDEYKLLKTVNILFQNTATTVVTAESILAGLKLIVK